MDLLTFTLSCAGKSENAFDILEDVDGHIDSAI